MKKITSLICTVAILTVLGGCSSKPTLVTPAPVEKTVVATSVAPVPKTFKVGDTVKLSNVELKVNKILTLKGNEWSKPKAGFEFFAVDCTITNTSDAELNVSSMMMFKITDKEGRACEQTFMVQGNGQLDGAVSVGRKMTGQYVVEAPKGAKGLELEFNADLFSTGQVIVKLN